MSREFQCLAQGLLEKLRSITNEEMEQNFGKFDRGNGMNIPNDSLGNVKMKVPPFRGKYDPEAYLEWEKNVELVFDCQNFFEKKKVRLASNEFSDYAVTWWDQLCIKRRQSGEGPIETWAEMKRVMRRRFVPSSYYRNLDLQWLHRSNRSVDEYSQEMSDLMSRSAPQTTCISQLGSKEEDGSIVASKAKPEAKATTTIKASQSSSNTTNPTPNETDLAENFEKSEVMCLKVESKALNCMEVPASHVLECSKEFGGVWSNNHNYMSSLPHEGLNADPFLENALNGSLILRGIGRHSNFVFDPGDWLPRHTRIADFPTHRKAKLDSRVEDSGRIFLRKGGMM